MWFLSQPLINKMFLDQYRCYCAAWNHLEVYDGGGYSVVGA